MIPFHKYQGAGNDFILIDQREQQHIQPDQQALIARLCDRRFGIGADGLITLETAEGYHFAMRYYNADGKEGSLCGNGGRCIVAFAKKLGIIDKTCRFLASDGDHRASIREGQVAIEIHDVKAIESIGDAYFLDTGSPHYVQMVADAFQLDVDAEGRKVRYNDRFRAKGTNVNFISPEPKGGIRITTYERGVEAETLACGTGVTAAAIVYHLAKAQGKAGEWEIPVTAKGGLLSVRFQTDGEGHFKDIWLLGPATHVFAGEVVGS